MTPVASCGSRGRKALSEFLMGERPSLNVVNPAVDWISAVTEAPITGSGGVIDIKIIAVAYRDVMILIRAEFVYQIYHKLYSCIVTVVNIDNLL